MSPVSRPTNKLLLQLANAETRIVDLEAEVQWLRQAETPRSEDAWNVGALGDQLAVSLTPQKVTDAPDVTPEELAAVMEDRDAMKEQVERFAREVSRLRQDLCASEGLKEQVEQCADVLKQQEEQCANALEAQQSAHAEELTAIMKDRDVMKEQVEQFASEVSRLREDLQATKLSHSRLQAEQEDRTATSLGASSRDTSEEPNTDSVGVSVPPHPRSAAASPVPKLRGGPFGPQDSPSEHEQEVSEASDALYEEVLAQNNGLQAEVKVGKQEVLRISEELRDSNRERESLQLEVAHQKLLLEAAEDVRDEMEAEGEEALEKLRLKVRELEQRAGAAELEHEHEISEASDALYEEVRHLKREVVRLEAEAAVSAHDLESLNLELKALQKAFVQKPAQHTSTDQLVALTKERDALKQQVASKYASSLQLTNAETRIVDLEAEVQRLRQELVFQGSKERVEADARVAVLEAELANTSVKGTVQGGKDDLAQQLEEERKHVKQLQTIVTLLKAKETGGTGADKVKALLVELQEARVVIERRDQLVRSLKVY